MQTLAKASPLSTGMQQLFLRNLSCLSIQHGYRLKARVKITTYDKSHIVRAKFHIAARSARALVVQLFQEYSVAGGPLLL